MEYATLGNTGLLVGFETLLRDHDVRGEQRTLQRISNGDEPGADELP